MGQMQSTIRTITKHTLEVTEEEVKTIILTWAKQVYSTRFDYDDTEVEIDCGPYQGCNFSCTVSVTLEVEDQ